MALLVQWSLDPAIMLALSPNHQDVVMLHDALARSQQPGDDVMDERDLAGLLVAFLEPRKVRHEIIRRTRNGASRRERAARCREILAEAMQEVGN
jgi:hypothetical protein